MADLILLSLALWIVTHTVSQEIPLTANAPKPLSCQLCLSGWVSIVAGGMLVLLNGDAWLVVPALAAWALAVLVEAVYMRLNVFVL